MRGRHLHAPLLPPALHAEQRAPAVRHLRPDRGLRLRRHPETLSDGPVGHVPRLEGESLGGWREGPGLGGSRWPRLADPRAPAKLGLTWEQQSCQTALRVGKGQRGVRTCRTTHMAVSCAVGSRAAFLARIRPSSKEPSKWEGWGGAGPGPLPGALLATVPGTGSRQPLAGPHGVAMSWVGFGLSHPVSRNTSLSGQCHRPGCQVSA